MTTMTNETLNEPTAEYGADALIVCDNLVRIYQVENIEVQALQGLDLLVDKGEMIAIVGQSGSGKSTLLNVLSGLDVPTAGAARVAGWDLLHMARWAWQIRLAGGPISSPVASSSASPSPWPSPTVLR